MLGTKLAFSTAYHPQTDGLAEIMIQTMEDIIRRFCAYGMEYKDQEGYTHDWVTLLPAIQLAYNTILHSTTGKSPSPVGKVLNTLLPVDHLKKNHLTIHPTAKDFHYMWKNACDTASRCIAEAKEYNKQRYDKTHKEPDFKQGDQANAVEAQLTEAVSKKNQVFSLSLVKPFHQTGEYNLPSRSKSPNPQDIVELEASPVPMKNIINARKIRINEKDNRPYVIRFKNQTADKDKWLAQEAIPDFDLHLRRFRASRGSENSHQ
ncbi:hypothetical protein O181_010923 [Austropuccinia psidii MF-1]|uniref:Integrase catalytic domain-containing protein n=1 Tax=Austropuccinia psidii MF-1 TaxID=1389203 RepID=A0A9Q3BUA9_9BASI|nr:hypothetical protein [Austropuccinia psidii MF-1]